MDESFQAECICCTNSKYKKHLHIYNSKIELEKVKCKDIYIYTGN